MPNELKLIDRLDRAVGGFFAQPIRDRRDVMQAYLMLQVIEERALTQFALFEVAFRGSDDETADVIAGIARDEERHLKYCHAIARRYAPDARDRARRRCASCASSRRAASPRTAAPTCSTCSTAAGSPSNPVEKLFWQAVNGLSARGEPPLTQFAYAEVA